MSGQLLARCPELDTAAGHVRTFATMMTNRDGHLLDDWIAATGAGDSPHLASFAAGLRRDHAAVTAGLTPALQQRRRGGRREQNWPREPGLATKDGLARLTATL